MAPEYRRLIERLRELATQAEGELHAIPLDRFAEELPEGLTHDELVRRTMPAEDRPDGQPRIDVRPIRLRGRSHPPTGTKQIRKIEVELRVVRALPLDAIKDDAARYDALGLATEDGEILARVIEWPGNLAHTAAGDPTGCRSLTLESSAPAVRSGARGAGHPQLVETVHVFRGWALIDGGVTPAPANTTLPAINVDGGGAAELGVTLVGTPGAWTDAVQLRHQWLRDGAPIEGATTLRYVIGALDVGTSLRLRETAHGVGGVTSAESSAIVPGAPTPDPLPEGFPFDPEGALAPRHLWIAGHRVFSPDGEEVYSFGDVVTGGAVHRVSAARSPLEVAASANLNGQPSVRFRAAELGVDSKLAATDVSSHLFVQQPAAGATIFLAWFKSAATQDSLLDANNLTTNRTGWNLFHTLPGGTLTFRIGRDLPSQATVVNVTSGAGSVPAGAHFAVVRLLTGGSPEYEIRVDGALLLSGAFAVAPGTDLAALGGLTVGGRSSTTTSNGLTGELGALGFFARRITDDELGDLETWLARYRP